MTTRLLTEEQQLLRESAREFLTNEYPLSWVREWMDADAKRARDLSGAAWRKLAELGWLGLSWPEELGGAELGFVDQAIVLEELGRALLPVPYLSTLISACILDRAGDAELRRDALTAVCAGERVLSFAVAEAAGEDADDLEARAHPRGEGYQLTGVKRFVPDADAADQLLVAARTSDVEVSWLLVERDADGVEIEKLEAMDQTRPLYELRLQEAPARLVGEPGGFARIWSEVLPRYWTALAAEAVGGSQRVLEDSVAYAKERVQFDKPIGANQAIKHKCSNMLIRVEGARAITNHAARALAAGNDEGAMAASMAKAYASEAYREVAGEGIQIHGGVGFTWEYDCHLFYKRARTIEITAGHPDVHRERLAEQAGL